MHLMVLIEVFKSSQLVPQLLISSVSEDKCLSNGLNPFKQESNFYFSIVLILILFIF